MQVPNFWVLAVVVLGWGICAVSLCKQQSGGWGTGGEAGHTLGGETLGRVKSWQMELSSFYHKLFVLCMMLLTCYGVGVGDGTLKPE